MEYCKKCGAKIYEKTGCCTFCGLHVKDYKKKSNHIAPIIITVIVVIVAIVLLLAVKTVFNLFETASDIAPNDDYLEVVEEMIDVVYVDTNIEKFVDLMPQTVVDAMIQKGYDGDEAAFQKNMQELYAEMEEIKADENSVSWKINEEISVLGVQLNHYQEQLETGLGVDIDIRSAKALDIVVTYTQDGEPKEEGMYIIVGLIDDEWCLITFSED